MTFDEVLKILKQASIENSSNEDMYITRWAETMTSDNHANENKYQASWSEEDRLERRSRFRWPNDIIHRELNLPSQTTISYGIKKPSIVKLMIFTNSIGETIGEIIYENKMFLFKGNMEESMKLLIDYLNNNFKLDKLEIVKKDNTEKIIDSDRNVDLE